MLNFYLVISYVRIFLFGMCPALENILRLQGCNLKKKIKDREMRQSHKISVLFLAIVGKIPVFNA